MNLQRNTAWLRGFVLAFAAAFMCSCVTQGVPSHGGGKRFYYEQALLTKATDSAVNQLDFSSVSARNKPVNLYVISVGDEGGGSEGGGGSSFFGLSGLLSPLNGANASGAGTGYVTPPVPDGKAHAFANARDIEFLRGKVIQSMMSQGVQVAIDEKETAGDVYVLVSEFGTAKEGFDMIVYKEATLSARTAVEAFFVGNAAKGKKRPFKALGAGECTTEYLARYIFGAGPLQGIQIKVMPGAIPANIVWPNGRVPQTTNAK